MDEFENHIRVLVRCRKNAMANMAETCGRCAGHSRMGIQKLNHTVPTEFLPNFNSNIYSEFGLKVTYSTRCHQHVQFH